MCRCVPSASSINALDARHDIRSPRTQTLRHTTCHLTHLISRIHSCDMATHSRHSQNDSMPPPPCVCAQGSGGLYSHRASVTFARLRRRTRTSLDEARLSGIHRHTRPTVTSRSQTIAFIHTHAGRRRRHAVVFVSALSEWPHE